jgi:DNA-binding NtrC family response regulator
MEPLLSSARDDVLLVAADWQSRALTLAELQEAGYKVTAMPGLRYALAALAHRRVSPSVILLDVHSDEEVIPERVADLLALVPDIPLILVAGAFDLATWEPFRPHVATLLHRPISVRTLLATVQYLLPRT